MKKSIAILLGGLLISTPAYADENDGNLNNQNPGDYNENNHPGNYDENNNPGNNPGNYDGNNNPGDSFQTPGTDGNQNPNDGQNQQPQQEVTPPVETPVQQGASRESVVVAVNQESYSISGRVTLNDKPVQAKVEVGNRVIETDPNGRYVAQELQPGTHTVKVVEVNGKAVNESVDVEIENKNKVNIDIDIKDDSADESEVVEEEIQKNDPQIKEASKALIFAVVGVVLLTLAGLVALFLRKKK
ncbi:carboxypeptidase-like regulatory domain-containing protein [Nosocomiicoccus massiliensis]|uniref:Carboxypeptidase-like regulatory domain-containing protein n=1 Tax=Nosocomiicoccus massiliensis TaxID=1232430 RepID=A0AAF0YGV2_9STAP|nr:carboxypeptidase-like regulatory domain-containing protein [Nosocomiicoccus massiliensis]WOS95623.1 carboxypeptidase-like regulatory domain-containing protein [Nosocomiicoccus massiliensis]